MGPEQLWWLSTRLHRRGWTSAARAVKALNFAIYKAVLPSECDIQRDVRLYHHGVGVVVHPRTIIGRGVTIGHGVCLSGGEQVPGSTLGVIVEDGAFIGAGAYVLPRRGKSLRIGAGSIVGANTTVVGDVPAGRTVVSPGGVVLEERPAALAVVA